MKKTNEKTYSKAQLEFLKHTAANSNNLPKKLLANYLLSNASKNDE